MTAIPFREVLNALSLIPGGNYEELLAATESAVETLLQILADDHAGVPVTAWGTFPRLRELHNETGLRAWSVAVNEWLDALPESARERILGAMVLP